MQRGYEFRGGSTGINILDTDGNTVIRAEWHNGMPRCYLQEIFDLPILSTVEVNLSDGTAHTDDLSVWHLRAAHTSESILIEGHKRMAFVGMPLHRKYMTKKGEKQAIRKANQRRLCKSCALTKITRKSFTDREEPRATRFAEYISCDISVYYSQPSMEGYRYVLAFTDHATKELWEYGLSERTGDEVLKCVKDLVENKLPTYGPGHRWQHFHSDGGRELLDSKVKKYLLEQFGSTFTWSSTDSPELNATSERRFRTLGERTHAMLTHSGLPKEFWFKAYKAACYITRRLPTKTAFGWMSSPHEAVPGGTVPDLSRLRIWGCKAYVKLPRDKTRKDWEDKSRIGYFVAYSENKMGYTVWLPQYQTEETSVHVLFDESIPSRGDDYYKELDEIYELKTSPEERAVEDYADLVGAYHIDEGLLFKTTRIVVRKGLIVGYRALVVAGKTCLEEKTPIHVADLKEMSDIFAKRLEMTVNQPTVGGRSTAEVRHGGDRKKQRKKKRKEARILRGGASNSNVANEQTKRKSEDSSEKPAVAEQMTSTRESTRRSTRMKRPTSLANVSRFG